jgi:hypothetical protein
MKLKVSFTGSVAPEDCTVQEAEHFHRVLWEFVTTASPSEVQDFCDHIGIGTQTLERWVREGSQPMRRTMRAITTELEARLAHHIPGEHL